LFPGVEIYLFKPGFMASEPRSLYIIPVAAEFVAKAFFTGVLPVEGSIYAHLFCASPRKLHISLATTAHGEKAALFHNFNSVFNSFFKSCQRLENLRIFKGGNESNQL